MATVTSGLVIVVSTLSLKTELLFELWSLGMVGPPFSRRWVSGDSCWMTLVISNSRSIPTRRLRKVVTTSFETSFCWVRDSCLTVLKTTPQKTRKETAIVSATMLTHLTISETRLVPLFLPLPLFGIVVLISYHVASPTHRLDV